MWEIEIQTMMVPDHLLQELLGEHGELVQTGSPCVFCSPLPNLWKQEIFFSYASNYVQGVPR